VDAQPQAEKAQFEVTRPMADGNSSWEEKLLL
jgi:hypothetical protein